MDKENAYALLLQDVEGFKEGASFRGYGKEWKSITVVKGSLLTRLNPSVVNTIQKDYKCLVNYRVDDTVKKLRGDSPVKNVEFLYVDCDILFYVSRLQRDFMLGVTNPSSRLEVLGRLEWVESLVKGSNVYVTIATITSPVRGVIQYIGGLPGEEGRKFGVELMEKKGQGTNNGSFKETEFFKCGKDCAVFVAMDKLTDGNTCKAAKVTPTPDSSVIKSAVTDKNGNPVRLEDYVIFYNKDNEKHRGTVRWIGNNKAIQPDGIPIIGIEAEKHLNLKDVPHNIKDRYIRDYFSSKKSKVFLPITFVLRDTSNSNLADKQESIHGNSDASPTSPHTDDIQAPQPLSMIKRENDIEAIQPQSLTQGDTDTKTPQPQSLTNRNQPPTKRKVEHNYDTLQDLIIPDSCNPYNLKKGSLVQWLDLNQYGVIKWIGSISGDKNVYAGLEMEEDVSENGRNGELMNVKYFDCKPGRGKFALLASLKPDKRSKKISDNAQPVEPNPYNLKVGSVIEYGDPIKYGEIKWIGELQNMEGLFACIEMDDDIDEAYDGEWAGRECFKCKQNKGTFILLSGLKPGIRKKLEGIQPTNNTNTFDSVHKQINSNANKQQNQYDLEVGSAVQFGDPLKYGVIKWIGAIPEYGETLQAGLKMDHEEDNYHYGTHNDKQYFPGRGRFIELKTLQPDRRVVPTSSEDAEKNDDNSKEGMLNLKIGSRIKHSSRYGIIKWIGNLVGLSDKKYAGVEMEEVVSNPQDGIWRGERIFDSQPGRGKFLPMSALQPDDRCVKEPQLNNEHVVYKFEVTDMVQFDNPPQYGTIRWIGTLPDLGPGYAGIETEDYVIDPTDGKWKGASYFHPPAGKGKFLQLSKLKPDERFIVQSAQVNPLEKHKAKIETCVRPPNMLVPTEHIGLPKGIQGQQNSCYLDATLYGMFAFSDAFDGLFLEREIGGTNHEIQEIIQQNIVYPLRKHHIVPQESVLELRSCLDKIQKSKGLIADEKDPEEFLNILFKHVFHLESYLKIRRSTGKEGEFFVQLFLEPDADVSPDTESLLRKMFVDQGIIFDEYPTRLLLQVPRYGKHFKVFRKVIPKLELDVKTICNLEQPCLVCGNGGSVMCSECCKEEAFVNGIKKPFFCNACSNMWHGHYKRKQHKPWVKKCQDFATGTLQLLSVLCIETSHYVCFTRITGSGKDEWVFFDSMAKRPADEFNRPEVKCCTDTLNEWVYGDKDIINTVEKPPQLARRFVSDVYLCIYVDKEGTMYK